MVPLCRASAGAGDYAVIAIKSLAAVNVCCGQKAYVLLQVLLYQGVYQDQTLQTSL